jgi:protein disulfide-isomerase-like protein
MAKKNGNSKYLTIGLLLLIILVFFCNKSNTENFEANEGKHTFKFYYAPWCGHCKKAMPEFNILETQYKGNSNVKVQKVDCDDPKNKAEVKGMGIQGFPTYYFFENGKVNKDNAMKYEGGRSLDEMKSFLDKKV